MQLSVLKADGTVELYLHTKVMGTIAAALSESKCFDPELNDQLAEAVTTFLRRRFEKDVVTSDEIHAMLEMVLCDTGYEHAALLLNEHRIQRQIRRGRIEVIWYRWEGISDDFDDSSCPTEILARSLWNKSRIVRDLEVRHGLEHFTARAVAGAVEEKVLGMNCRNISNLLVKELVRNEWIALHQAQSAMESTAPASKPLMLEPAMSG